MTKKIIIIKKNVHFSCKKVRQNPTNPMWDSASGVVCKPFLKLLIVHLLPPNYKNPLMTTTMTMSGPQSKFNLLLQTLQLSYKFTIVIQSVTNM